jgi:hypothetical protein
VKRAVVAYFRNTRSAAVGIAVTLPLLILYNIGLLMPGADRMNGADFLTSLVAGTFGLEGLLALNGALVLVSLVMIVVLLRKGRFSLGQWFVLGTEGLLYGVLLGWVVVLVMQKARLLAAAAAATSGDHSVAEVLSHAAGAGYWEELLFRLVMVGGPLFLAVRYVKGRDFKFVAGRIAIVAVAVVVSSVLFSLAHYVGGHEPPELRSFWFRALAGGVFSLLFLVRGFAVAAYTHFLYDVMVMLG